MSDNLEKESEVTIEVSEEYAEALGIMASLYGMTTSDFLSRTLNGEMDGVAPERMPTPEEIMKVDKALRNDTEDLKAALAANGVSYEDVAKAMDDMEEE